MVRLAAPDPRRHIRTYAARAGHRGDCAGSYWFWLDENRIGAPTLHRREIIVMPYAPKRPCRHPACREYASERGYCAAHQPMAHEAGRRYDETTRKDDPALAWANHFRSSSEWQNLRKLYRSVNPCCCDPFKRHGEYPPLGKPVNHIIPLRICFHTGRQHLAREWSNLSTLCYSCDARVGAMERKGEPTEHLFAHCNKEPISIGFA
jgi:hypothetical protein